MSIRLVESFSMTHDLQSKVKKVDSPSLIESFKRFGVFKGFFLSIKRIIKCNPFGSFGLDPVPNINKK